MEFRSNHALLLKDDPLWYKDAIIYELNVRAFCDTNADGIGDLRGVAERLDYLQDLGVTALWLLPFYPSPLRDDGYDISDYTGVNPIYGDLDDFKNLLGEAHRRGMRVITELVINHTSDQHPWFQRARRAEPGSPWRDYYVWSDTPDKFTDARIMFEIESSNWTWDPVAKAHYWHRFYSHQPDLNFDNPAVHDAVLAVLDFWLDLGVDGMRLDAIPFLYEREGTSCESLPETHAFLRKLRRHVDDRFRNRMLLAEANHWPEEMVAYFGAGDECHMAFHFPLMPRLFMAIRMEERFPILDILQQTPAIPDNSQWALFLRNHDELTLAMITDEDRDYMFRVYAQDVTSRVHLGIRRRLAPLLDNHRGKIELMNGVLFSLPGTPVLYYGDEIGMGDNIYLGDRNGVRTPMQWSGGWNAGFSTTDPERLAQPLISNPLFGYQAVNVESQKRADHSLLNWMRKLIAVRQSSPVFSRGKTTFLKPANHRVLAYLRTLGKEQVLCVYNLSSSAQAVELDLQSLAAALPIEMFGRSLFPRIGELPYMLTLGPYAFFWFKLRRF
jgi:maltose alpha-D-glucosyltransferase/alpha-amylase